MIVGIGRSCRRPISKSFGSCAGVTFTAPVPNDGSTWSSATIGMLRFVSGSVTCLPIRCWYRSSSGWTATAVSPSIVSTRVVATTIDCVAVAVADGDEFAGLVLVVDLDVRDRGEVARAPVDDPLGPVDQVVVVEPLEDGLDGLGEPVVEGEPLARPVDAVAEAAHLAADRAAVALLPLPRLGDELLALVVEAALALGLGQVPFDEVLHGDAGVVHARQPERVEAAHPGPARQGIHDRVLAARCRGADCW